MVLPQVRKCLFISHYYDDLNARSVGIVLVLTSIYMPLFYALSEKGAAIINAVFMISLIVLAQPAAMLIHMMSEKGAVRAQTLFHILINILLLSVVAAIYIKCIHE